jgi:protein-tyrosine phosphatase
MKVLLFLCTGNYYRSRFAEEMFNFLAPVECPGWTAVSRGIALGLGINNVGPIAKSTARALQKQGIVFNLPLARMPLQLEPADLESSDHIVALNETEHFPLMKKRFSSWLDTCGPCRIEYWHVHDIDRMAPEQGLPLIVKQLQVLMMQLSSKNPKLL